MTSLYKFHTDGKVLYKSNPFHFCTDKEREKAKERNIKALAKMYELHNEYVLSARAARVYHQHHYSQIQPGLLHALQSLQEEMVLML